MTVECEITTERINQKVTTFVFGHHAVRQAIEQEAARMAGNLSGEHVTVGSVRHGDGFTVRIVEDYTRCPQAASDSGLG